MSDAYFLGYFTMCLVGEKSVLSIFSRFFFDSLGTGFLPVFIQAPAPFPRPLPTPCCRPSAACSCPPHQHCIKPTGFNTVLIRFYTGFFHVADLWFSHAWGIPLLCINVGALSAPVFYRFLLHVVAPTPSKKKRLKIDKTDFWPTKHIMYI